MVPLSGLCLSVLSLGLGALSPLPQAELGDSDVSPILLWFTLGLLQLPVVG